PWLRQRVRATGPGEPTRGGGLDCRRATTTRMPLGPPPWTRSTRHSRQPLELNQPADVVPEVHHPDLNPRPRDADGAHDLAAHRVLLVAEYVLDTRAHPRARRVRRLLALRQRTISCGATVDMALQALRLQARLNLHRAVGAVRPDPIAGIGEIEHIVQLLTVVYGRVRRIPFADQLVRLVHADVVLV